MGVFPTKILLATDASRDASLAAQAAVDLSRETRSELHVVHVWRDQSSRARQWYPPTGDHSFFLQELLAHELLEEQTERLESAGVQVAGAHLRRGDPSDEIVRLGEELDAGLLILGSRGIGTVARLALGSVSERVVYLANRPTLVVRGEGRVWPPARVVVGEDSSEQAKRAAEAALSISKLFGAESILVRTAYPQPQFLPSGFHRHTQRERIVLARMLERDRLKRSLEKRARELEESLGSRPQVRVAVADAAAFILEVAEEGDGATLVAVGSRGLSKVKSVMLGSVSRKVLSAASGPVLISP
jgi:nucleotide-binding universal stress UspA family protein